MAVRLDWQDNANDEDGSRVERKRISESSLADLVVTDSVPLSDEAKASEKLRVVSIAPLLSEAIRRINNEESVSSLFV